MWQNKSSQKVSIQLVILVSTVMFSTCTKGSITFSDGVFNTSDWQLVIEQGGNGGSVSFSQESTGGNPDEYLRITDTVNAAPPYSNIAGVFLNTSAIYNPQTQGEIVSLEYSEDSVMFQGWGDGQTAGLALRQNGIIYYAYYPGSGMINANRNSWTHHSFTSLNAENFGHWYVPNHPDFSSEGSPVEFGFYRGNSAPAFGYTIIAGIDNWSVTIHNKPPVEAGSLHVIIEPQEAVDAGAKWRRVGTAAWLDSGQIETGVPIGEYIIEFKDVPGFVTPDNQTGTLELQGELNFTGIYTYIGIATLSVETLPVAGEIFVDGEYKGLGSWEDTITAGHHTLAFGSIPGYITPSDQLVIISNDQAKTCNANYEQSTHYGTIEVVVHPNEAAEETTYDIVGPATFYGSGKTYQKENVPLGEYTIYYGNAGLYQPPQSETQMLEKGQTILFEGNYIELAWLHVKTEPEGIYPNIYVNGEFKGKGQWSCLVPVSETLGVGNYVVSFGDYPSYVKPAEREITVGSAHQHNPLQVVGNYTPIPGMVSIVTNLDQAHYYVTFPDGINHHYQGEEKTIEDCPVGEYIIVFQDVEGYLTPNSQTDILIAGGAVAFCGTYVSNIPERTKILEVPYYYQFNSQWCGPCCVAMLSRYFDSGISLVKPWQCAVSLGSFRPDENPNVNIQPAGGYLVRNPFILNDPYHGIYSGLDLGDGYIEKATRTGWSPKLYGYPLFGETPFAELKGDIITALAQDKPVLIGATGTLQHFFIVVGADDEHIYVNNSSLAVVPDRGVAIKRTWGQFEADIQDGYPIMASYPEVAPVGEYPTLSINLNQIGGLTFIRDPGAEKLSLCWDGRYEHGYVFARNTGIDYKKGEWKLWEKAMPFDKPDTEFFQYPTQDFRLECSVHISNSAPIEKEYEIYIEIKLAHDLSIVKAFYGDNSGSIKGRTVQKTVVLWFDDERSFHLSNLNLDFDRYILTIMLVDKDNVLGYDLISIPFKVGRGNIN